MSETETSAGWASMARETFEYNVVPWAGRSYSPWVRACSRPHPRDARGMVQLPEAFFSLFQERAPGQRLSRQAAEGLGYPKLPVGRPETPLPS